MPKHLFILCSHSSGSTAMMKLLSTSPQVSSLPREGQFMPEAEPLMREDPWNPAYKIDWPQVRQALELYWDMSKPVLLEKSPPNLLRACDMVPHFDDPHFIVMVRNPYAYCEGTRRRNHFGLGYSDTASYGEIATGWVRECRIQMENLKKLPKAIMVTYEQFTEDTRDVAKRIVKFMPELKRLDVEATFWIHSLQGSLKRSVTNLNESQIARLSDEDIAEITAVLRQHPDVMKFFHYRLLENGVHPAERFRQHFINWYQSQVWRRVQQNAYRIKNKLSGS